MQEFVCSLSLKKKKKKITDNLQGRKEIKKLVLKNSFPKVALYMCYQEEMSAF